MAMCCSHVSSWPHGFFVGIRISAWGSVNAKKPKSYNNRLPAGKGDGGSLGDALLVHPPCRGLAAEEAREQGMDQQDLFDRMVLLLAALTCGLFSRVLGADNARFGAVMGTRGDAGTTAGAAARGAGASSSGVTTVAASAAEPPSRCARAARERAGALPRVRSAASSTGKRT